MAKACLVGQGPIGGGWYHRWTFADRTTLNLAFIATNRFSPDSTWRMQRRRLPCARRRSANFYRTSPNHLGAFSSFFLSAVVRLDACYSGRIENAWRRRLRSDSCIKYFAHCRVQDLLDRLNGGGGAKLKFRGSQKRVGLEVIEVL